MILSTIMVILVKYSAIDPDASLDVMSQGTHSSRLQNTNTHGHLCQEMHEGDQRITESFQRDRENKDDEKVSIFRVEDVIGKAAAEVYECEEPENKSSDQMDNCSRDFLKSKLDQHEAKYFMESVNAFKKEGKYVYDNILFCDDARKKCGEKDDFEENPYNVEENNIHKSDEEDENASKDVEDIENSVVYNEDLDVKSYESNLFVEKEHYVSKEVMNTKFACPDSNFKFNNKCSERSSLSSNGAIKQSGEKEAFEEDARHGEENDIKKSDEKDKNTSEEDKNSKENGCSLLKEGEQCAPKATQMNAVCNDSIEKMVATDAAEEETSPETNECAVANKEGKRKFEEPNDNNCERPDTVTKRTIRKAVRRSINPSASHSFDAPANARPQKPEEVAETLTEERNRSLSVDDEKPLDMKEKLRSVQFGVFDESEERGGASQWNYKGPDDIEFEKNVASFETFKEAYNTNIDFKCRVFKGSDKHIKKFEKPLDKQNAEQINKVQDKKNHCKKSLWQRFLKTFLKH